MNFAVVTAVPKVIILDEVEQTTLKDNVLHQVVKAMLHGQWKSIQKSADTKLRSFYNVPYELTVSPNAKIVTRGSRIVIPATLQERAVALAHEGHQYIIKTKSLLREMVWFLCIEQMKKNAMKCSLQVATPRTKYEPINMTSLPELSTDFYGSLPNCEYLLVIIDEYSRYPVVKIVNSTSASSAIHVIDKVMSMFGIPDVLKSDNGPPFYSELV